MYVIYPAEELLRIYESPIHRVSLTWSDKSNCQVSKYPNQQNSSANFSRHNTNSSKASKIVVKDKQKKNIPNNKKINNSTYERNKLSNCPIMQNNRNNGEERNNPLKELTHASLNESLKQHNGNALKLVQTGEYVVGNCIDTALIICKLM